VKIKNVGATGNCYINMMQTDANFTITPIICSLSLKENEIGECVFSITVQSTKAQRYSGAIVAITGYGEKTDT